MLNLNTGYSGQKMPQPVCSPLKCLFLFGCVIIHYSQLPPLAEVKQINQSPNLQAGCGEISPAGCLGQEVVSQIVGIWTR